MTTIKLVFLLSFLAILTSTANSSAQTYPQWDTLPDTDLSSGNGPGSFWGFFSDGVGYGQNVYFFGIMHFTSVTAKTV